MSPIYSICMCNYNMAPTLERSLNSILRQINENFEVVIVDDGSSDHSIDVITQLQTQHANLNLIQLERDSRRKLGLTRNVSIKAAKGKYVLTNIDCDDVYGPYIEDFTKIYHQIEDATKEDFYLKGNNINMARRDFLVSFGPYRNLFRGEDRDMWIRLASIDAFQPIEHQDFVIRLPKTRSEKAKRTLVHTWDDLKNNFIVGAKLKDVLYRETAKVFAKTNPVHTALIRLALAIPACFVTLTKPKLVQPSNMNTAKKFAAYREQKIWNF